VVRVASWANASDAKPRVNESADAVGAAVGEAISAILLGVYRQVAVDVRLARR
jgi:hypothetical protein